MKNKEEILKTYKKKYKQSFLLAWARFLTYEELEKTDNLEAYNAALLGKVVKTPADWNKLVLPYVEDNVKKALCIDLNRAANDITQHNGMAATTYASDMEAWLDILSDTELKLKSSDIEDIKEFYNAISKKYKFEIQI